MPSGRERGTHGVEELPTPAPEAGLAAGLLTAKTGILL